MFLQWFNKVFTKISRRKAYEQLQWQRFLLRTGVPATVHILDTVEEDDQLLGYVQLRMWVEFKIKGGDYIQTYANAVEQKAKTTYCRYGAYQVLPQ